MKVTSRETRLFHFNTQAVVHICFYELVIYTIYGVFIVDIPKASYNSKTPLVMLNLFQHLKRQRAILRFKKILQTSSG